MAKHGRYGRAQKAKHLVELGERNAAGRLRQGKKKLKKCRFAKDR